MATTKEKDLLNKIKLLKQELDAERKTRKNTDIKHFKSETVIIVTNRIPVTLKKDPITKKWTTKIASGGLVSAMSCLKMKRKWIGWVGTHVEADEKDEVNKILAKINCIPVYLPKDIYESYYNGFSNDVLWPVLHYVHLPIKTSAKERDYWYSYEEVNRRFAAVVLENSDIGEIIWVHDYHLMVMPQYLRQVRSNAKIAWFLHTPFPNCDVFRTLSYRKELLTGVLACDMVGFHIYNYARNFKNACAEILGCNAGADAVEYNGKLTLVDAFPIGIDVQKFRNVTQTQSFKDKLEELRKRHEGVKLIVGIDRLDYIKGILHKLVAFERFLDSNQEWTDKVTLVQIAVPTRTEVPEYQKLADRVHEMVGRINGKFSNLTHVPIQYLDTSVDFDTLTALYSLADVFLVTSLRDGMNLVSYEFVASQLKSPGVLILSEFAGAAQSLGAGCIQINPWNIEEVSRALRVAVTISEEEKIKLYGYAKKYIEEHSVQAWSEDFIYTLKQSWEITNFLYKEPKIPPELNTRKLVDCFCKSKRKLIFCGIIGTLTEIEPMNNMKLTEHFDYVKLSESNRKSLSILANDENTTVVIATSRRKEFIDKLMGEIPAILCAENGYYLKNIKYDTEWKKKGGNINLNWLDAAEKIMQYFCERTPDSFIERTETSVCWHYVESGGDFSDKQARDLISNLQNGPLLTSPTEVLHDQQNKFIKVRTITLNKKFAFSRALHHISSGTKPPKRKSQASETVGISSIYEATNPNNAGEKNPRTPSESKARRKTIQNTQKISEKNPKQRQSLKTPEKSGQAQSILSACAPFDFVLCLGNYFDSDQDVFLALNEANNVNEPLLTDPALHAPHSAPEEHEKPPTVFTVSVGKRKSLASDSLNGPADVESLLRSLSNCGS